MTLQILIVDDDSGFRALCARLLRRDSDYDYLTCEAADATTAINAIANHPFDCILIDYGLPETNGLDLIHTLRNDYNIGAPLILLSAEDSEEITTRALEGGATRFLPKSAVGNSGLTTAIQQEITGSGLQRICAVRPADQVGTATDNAN